MHVTQIIRLVKVLCDKAFKITNAKCRRRLNIAEFNSFKFFRKKLIGNDAKLAVVRDDTTEVAVIREVTLHQSNN